MKFGFVLPEGDAKTAVRFAQEAEQAGWDGFFMWEPVWGVDAWVSLTAVAMRTNTIKLGTMLTPLSRMRPWKLASETATLDNLSDGRVILAVGLGAINSGFETFGEVTDLRTRAELLDEGLDILTGLWKGQPFSYEGKHYQIQEFEFPILPDPPAQQPRIPIWVVGAWPRPKSMARVVNYDGILPYIVEHIDGKKQSRPTAQADLQAIQTFVQEKRTLDTPFDFVMEGKSTPTDHELMHNWAQAGASWWIESPWGMSLDDVWKRMRQGPAN